MSVLLATVVFQNLNCEDSQWLSSFHSPLYTQGWHTLSYKCCWMQHYIKERVNGRTGHLPFTQLAVSPLDIVIVCNYCLSIYSLRQCAGWRRAAEVTWKAHGFRCSLPQVKHSVTGQCFYQTDSTLADCKCSVFLRQSACSFVSLHLHSKNSCSWKKCISICTHDMVCPLLCLSSIT